MISAQSRRFTENRILARNFFHLRRQVVLFVKRTTNRSTVSITDSSELPSASTAKPDTVRSRAAVSGDLGGLPIRSRRDGLMSALVCYYSDEEN